MLWYLTVLVTHVCGECGFVRFFTVNYIVEFWLLHHYFAKMRFSGASYFIFFCVGLICFAFAMSSSNCGSWASAGWGKTSQTNFFYKHEVSSVIPINWFISFNGRLFADMTLTLHKSQVHCSGVTQHNSEVAVHSCPLLCVAKLGSGFLFCWSLLRNNNMAANLQRFTSSYDSRCFAHVAVECRRLGK